MYARCGDIFDAAFVSGMSSFAQQADLSAQTQTLLTLIRGEAMLACLQSTNKSNCSNVHVVKRSAGDNKEDDDGEDEVAAKRLCRSSSTEDTVEQFDPVTVEDVDTAQDTSDTISRSSSLFPAQDGETWTSSSEVLDNATEQRHSVNAETDSPRDSAQGTAAAARQRSSSAHRRDAELLTPAVTTPFSPNPMFYYCLHRRRLKNVNLPK